MSKQKTIEERFIEIFEDARKQGWEMKPMKYFEIHADGVKEISQEEMNKLIALGADLMVNNCPFCPEDNPCNQPHCPYTKEE